MVFHALPCRLRTPDEEHEFCTLLHETRQLHFCYSARHMKCISEQYLEDLAFCLAPKKVHKSLMVIK